MKRYRVVLIWWNVPVEMGRCQWKGTVEAETVDGAIRKARQLANAPDRATSQTTRLG